jgi:hypothetical protein
MEYRIARDGQTYGPYTEAELREYLASGNLVETDLARTETMDKWLPLRKVLPRQKKPRRRTLNPAGLRTDIPAPPDMPWWMAMALAFVTGGTFYIAWNIFEAVWLYRADKNRRPLIYFGISALLLLFDVPEFFSKVTHTFFFTPITTSTNATFLWVAGIMLLLIGQFSMRRSLVRHFNETEPIGLRLGWFKTLMFGGIYFQYHFNRINDLRRSLTAPL